MEQPSCIWHHILALESKDVSLLSHAKSIHVLCVSENAVRVRKSTGNVVDIPRSLIETAAQEVWRRSRMTREEVYELIGRQRHSSAICALLAATRGFCHTKNPITLIARRVRGAGVAPPAQEP